MRWLRWIARFRAERETTRRLQALDDHLLRDIGLERGDIPRVVAALLDGHAARETRGPHHQRAASGAPEGSGWRPSAEAVR